MARKTKTDRFDTKTFFSKVGAEEIEERSEEYIAKMDLSRARDLEGTFGVLARAVIAMDPDVRTLGLNALGAAISASPKVNPSVRWLLPIFLHAVGPGLERNLERPDLSTKEFNEMLVNELKSSQAKQIADNSEACTGIHDYDPLHISSACAGAKVHKAIEGPVLNMLEKYKHRPMCPTCFGEQFDLRAVAAAAGKLSDLSEPSLVGAVSVAQAELLAAYDEILDIRGLELIHRPTQYPTLQGARNKGLTADPRVVKFLPKLSSKGIKRIWDAAEVLRAEHEGAAQTPNAYQMLEARKVMHVAVRRFARYTAMVKRLGVAQMNWAEKTWRSIASYADDRFTDEERKRFHATREKFLRAAAEQDWEAIREWFADWSKFLFGEIGQWLAWFFTWTKRIAVVSWVTFVVLTGFILFADPLVQVLLGSPGGWFNISYQVGDTLYLNVWPMIMFVVMVFYITSGIGTWVTRFLVAGLWGKMIGAVVNLASGEKPANGNMLYRMGVTGSATTLKRVGVLPEDYVVTFAEGKVRQPAEPLVDIATTSTVVSMITVLLVFSVYGVAGVFGAWWLHLLLAFGATFIGALIGLTADAVKRFRKRNKVEWQFNDVFNLKSWLMRGLFAALAFQLLAGIGLGTGSWLLSGISGAACRAKHSDPVEQAYFCDDTIRSMRPALFGPNVDFWSDTPEVPESVRTGKQARR